MTTCPPGSGDSSAIDDLHLLPEPIVTASIQGHKWTLDSPTQLEPGPYCCVSIKKGVYYGRPAVGSTCLHD